MLCGLAFKGFSIAPNFWGARSLSLGYASTAFNYDINSIFYNPSILSTVNYSLWGYQYQHSYLDYKDFGEELSDILGNNLKDFENLQPGAKADLFSKLQGLFQSRAGIYGFRANVPGFVSRHYGIAFSFINTAIINPVNPGNNFFNQGSENISNADIASLSMNFIGLKYKQISLSYSMEVHQSVSLGITLHYLNGKVTEFNRSITDDLHA